MRPSLLKIKGINSFSDEQIIQFDRLIEKGLFGIFGPTGSGKSSILDAITLVLYGNIARNSREFINTGTDRGEISFEFQILDGKVRKTYRVEREIKRKKNGGIETALARMMELNGEEINILAEGVTNVNNEVIKIIGLNSDDFTRSVVLPQGKFSEFLKLTGRERRNMLERIFGLEQYGKNLMDKINNERKKYNEKRIDLEGQLKGYEGITEDCYKEASEKLKALLREEQKLKVEIQKLDKEHEKNKIIWGLQEELKLYEATKKDLEYKKQQIEEKRNELIMGQKANLLKPYITNLKDIEEKIASNKSILEDLEEELPKVETLLKKIEREHNEVLKYKEEQIPNLIVKIENCKQAESMEKENEKLIKETEELEKVHTANVKNSKQKFEQLSKLKAKKSEIQEEIKQIEKYLEEIYIEPHIKEGLEEVYILQKDMGKMVLEKEEDEKLCKELSKTIEDNKLKLAEEEKAKENLHNLLNGLTEDFKKLEQSPLKEESVIFTNRIELEKKKEQLTSLEENLAKKLAIIKEIEELSNKKSSTEEKRNKYADQISETEKQIEWLKIEIKNIETESLAAQLAKNLHKGESCPVCGSTEHSKLAEGTERELLAEKDKELKKLEKNLVILNEEETKSHISLAQIIKEYDIKKSNLEDIEKLVKNQSIEEFKQKVASLEKKLEKLTDERDIYINSKAKIEEEINKNREAINKIDTSIVKLNTEIQKDSESFDILNNKVEKLCKTIKHLFLSIENIKSDFKIENIVDEYNQMKARDKERAKKDKQLKHLRETIEKENKQRENLEKQLNFLNLEIAKNKQQLNENKKHIALTITKINKLAENKDPGEYRMTLENKIKEVEKEEKTLKAKVEKSKALRQKIAEEKAVAKNNEISLGNDHKRKKLELEEKTKKQGFNSIEEIEQYLLKGEQLKELEKQITTYDDEVKKTENNIVRINNALDGKSLAEEDWARTQKLLTEKKNIQEEKSKIIGETQQIVNDVKTKLDIVKKLKKEEKEVTHKLDLLLELSRMLEGNRFVEYVAINQLKYISKEASKWLKDITRSRYALELDSSGNFIMRDDFNGGIRRATNTLSGGETFLTSLSLALALSSHIQLKGGAPLEFFFLDEGFGTLDNDLLEIIMNALERLHSEKLSVGIISHVEELKDRVPIKLIVSPPEFGGVGTVVKMV